MSAGKVSGKKYQQVIDDVFQLMVKHGVRDMLIVCSVNGQIRNTSISLNKDTNIILDKFSDMIDLYFRQAKNN